MVDVEKGVRRVTFALPLGIDHVHCYFLRSSGGGWILVDTGLGVRDPEAQWQPVLDELDAPVEQIVVTHMHPDHVGGARDLHELTGAPVLQGRDDYAQCVAAWGQHDGQHDGQRDGRRDGQRDGRRDGQRDPQRFLEWWSSHGMPEPLLDGLAREAGRLAAAVHWQRDPELVDAGDEIDGWRVEVLRGHADGHIVLLRDGIMIAGDAILAGITPAIGLYPRSRPDPLGDYLETLDRIEALAPRVAYAGHREPVVDPAARAREIRGHHEDRLERAQRALDGRPASGYDVSLELFPDDLSPTLRRFATAESLAHLERLVHEERAAREGLAYVRAASAEHIPAAAP